MIHLLNCVYVYLIFFFRLPIFSLPSRYADVIVHRQLWAALNSIAEPVTNEETQKITLNCNRRKQDARNAQVFVESRSLMEVIIRGIE